MTKGQNAFLNKMAEKQAYRELHIKLWTTQLCMDSFMMALNDPEYVGKDIFGKRRFNRLKKGIEKYYHMLAVGLTDKEEASHVRRLADERLAPICGEFFQPWPERYEDWDDRGI